VRERLPEIPGARTSHGAPRQGYLVIDPLTMKIGSCLGVALLCAGSACVPPGNAGPADGGAASSTAARPAPTTPNFQSPDLLKAPFEDNFDHVAAPPAAPAGDASTEAGTAEPGPAPGPDWIATAPGIWHVEKGRLCGEHAKNHGIWLKWAIPTNARVEFDAVSQSPDGDLKAEYWGDGRSYATQLSYVNATSYLTIFGGWHNKFHVLARINEHGTDRKEIAIDPSSDDPREKPVVAGQSYHFKVERNDGKTVRWWVDGIEMLTYADTSPLGGLGHDHFGFNDWDVKVCFDNVRIVPLP
jgi:hypothetical protein